MPNWVKNKVTFECEKNELFNLLDQISSDEKVIDFNNIKKMPEELKTVSGANGDIGYDLILYLEHGDITNLQKKLNYTWAKNMNIKTVDELVDFYKNDSLYNDYIDLGRKIINNVEKYGHRDLWSWAIDNWGTKWNASESYHLKENIIVFETVWSTPYPVLDQLSRMYPNTTIKVEFADENPGFNCGEYHLENGEVLYEREFNEVEACLLWGHDPYEIFDYMRRDKAIEEFLKDDNNNSSL